MGIECLSQGVYKIQIEKNSHAIKENQFYLVERQGLEKMANIEENKLRDRKMTRMHKGMIL